MAIGNRSIVSREIRTLFDVGSLGNLTDGQLLERFASGTPEAAKEAFTALVERHGPMVLRVCLGILSDPHDADDAFQAVFLILWRKSRGLWVRDSIGPWLHQVAHRTAKSSRAASLRRRRLLEAGGAALGSRLSQQEPEPADPDVHRLIHEELSRLPERYRVPIVLCDLESLSCEQAARVMSCPVATLKTRLIRGRARLRSGLIRRGLTPAASAELLGMLVQREMLMPGLVQSTVQCVMVASSHGAARAVLAVVLTALSRRVAPSLLTLKITLGAMLLAGLSLSASTGEGGSRDEPARIASPKLVSLALQEPPVEPPPPEAKAGQGEKTLAPLLKKIAAAVEDAKDQEAKAYVLISTVQGQFLAGDREAALDTARKAVSAASFLKPRDQCDAILRTASALLEAKENAKALGLIRLCRQKADGIEHLRARLASMGIIAAMLYDLDDRAGVKATIEAMRKLIPPTKVGPDPEALDLDRILQLKELVWALVYVEEIDEAFEVVEHCGAKNHSFHGMLYRSMAKALTATNPLDETNFKKPIDKNQPIQFKNPIFKNQRIQRETLGRIIEKIEAFHYVDERPYAQLAVTAARLGDYKEAKRMATWMYYDPLKDRSAYIPTASLSVSCGIALIEAESGHRDEARHSLRLAFSRFCASSQSRDYRGPKSPDELSEYATTLASLQDGKRAIDLCDKMNPLTKIQTLIDIAEAQRENGDRVTARETLRLVLPDALKRVAEEAMHTPMFGHATLAKVAVIRAELMDYDAAYRTLSEVLTPEDYNAAVRGIARSHGQSPVPTRGLEWVLGLEPEALRLKALQSLVDGLVAEVRFFNP
ncbi:RNA polymerase sigma factor [Singulisphaera sp. PoT]|uniref:RNA polymerase sigma factor n=1 Tax=Singulisphaera sp. PoT TaxID=3411797 RepID=UPI003BF4DA6F